MNELVQFELQTQIFSPVNSLECSVCSLNKYLYTNQVCNTYCTNAFGLSVDVTLNSSIVELNSIIYRLESLWKYS